MLVDMYGHLATDPLSLRASSGLWSRSPAASPWASRRTCRQLRHGHRDGPVRLQEALGSGRRRDPPGQV